jgi:hypothetical protein
MLKNVISEIPAQIKNNFLNVAEMIYLFYNKNLNDEYYNLALKLTTKLAKENPSDLIDCDIKTLAAAIINTIATTHTYDSPQVFSKNLASWFQTTQTDIDKKTNSICKILNLQFIEQDQNTKSKVGDGYDIDDRMMWSIAINGFTIDIRNAAHDLQVDAYEHGLIPYIPTNNK